MSLNAHNVKLAHVSLQKKLEEFGAKESAAVGLGRSNRQPWSWLERWTAETSTGVYSGNLGA